MKTETMIWTIVFAIAGIFLAWRTFSGDMGRAYSHVTTHEFAEVTNESGDPIWVDLSTEEAFDYDTSAAMRTKKWESHAKSSLSDSATDPSVDVDPAMTLGIWVAAFFTLAIFSFLYKDNPLYKIAESCVVGVSAAYWMVVGFWDVLVPNLFARLAPGVVQSWAMPGISSTGRDLWYLIPLILGVMLLWRLAPKGAWIARWPLAFIIGSTAGIRMVGFIQADFLSQIRNSVVPVIVMEPGGNVVWDSLRNIILVIGVLCCLVYFFFSFEHKGMIGHTARVGIWFLMVTFGAAFGYTVMGRIALLAIRVEFLLDDWLWFIDPRQQRVVEDVTAMIGGLFGIG